MDDTERTLGGSTGESEQKLRAAVSAGESGPVITLSGEADITTAAELSALMTGWLAEGTLYLTVDVAGLSFADSVSIRILILAARRLRQRGGGLVLLRPQVALIRVMQIMGADQIFTIWAETTHEPEP